jgi:hypothetical protein
MERFLGKVAIQEDGCWLWTGVTGGSAGRYGYFREGTKRTDPKVPAHRWVYEQLVGPIPVELELDHLCRVRLCVNPSHLEPVTHPENSRRARLDRCRSGRHDLTVVTNQRFDSQGRRRGCRACWLESQARRSR